MKTVQSKAINFAFERQRHRGFVGRGSLLARLDQLLVEESAARWVVVTGGPGMGKSALLSRWLARRAAAGELVATQPARFGFSTGRRRIHTRHRHVVRAIVPATPPNPWMPNPHRRGHR